MREKKYLCTLTNYSPSSFHPLLSAELLTTATKNENSGQVGSVLLVITSCLCLIQSSTTFLVLVPLLYKNKCALTFLKMQFCTAIATLSGYGTPLHLL